MFYLFCFVMNVCVCVSTDWWWKESAPTAWLFSASDLYSSNTPVIIIQNIWKFVYELCSGCFYNPPASFTFLPFDLNNFCRPNQVFICLFCRLRKNNKGRSIQKSRRKTKLNKASGKNVNIKMNQITDQNCDDRTVSHFCDVFASFPVICLDILYKLDFFVWHYLH